MIIDTLAHIRKYVALHPLFSQVAACVEGMDFMNHEAGRVVLKEGELFVNIDVAPPKAKEEARLETHNEFIDIQIPLTGEEVMGYSPRAALQGAEYDEARDITFYGETPQSFLTVKPGMFVVFFPEDAHAPAISDKGLKKIVIKVRVNK